MTNRDQAHVVIAEDNPVAREVLRGIIRHDDRLKLVGEAANGQVALELVESLRPDLVCLDVLMPGLDGIEVLRAIAEQYPDTRVILVTGQSTSEVVTEALKQGACGFVVKPFSADKLLRAIHGALAKPLQKPAPAKVPQAAADAASDQPAAAATEEREAAADAVGAPEADEPVAAKAWTAAPALRQPERRTASLTLAPPDVQRSDRSLPTTLWPVALPVVVILYALFGTVNRHFPDS